MYPGECVRYRPLRPSPEVLPERIWGGAQVSVVLADIPCQCLVGCAGIILRVGGSRGGSWATMSQPPSTSCSS